MIKSRRGRKFESAAYNSALNEVRYDVEHEFKPIDLPRNWYIGIDDVEYDYDELSATVFVLNDKEEVVETETVSIPVDAMKDYTTDEMYRLKVRMLEKINDVVEDFKDTWSDSEDYNESKVKHSRCSRMFESDYEQKVLRLPKKFDDANEKLLDASYILWDVYKLIKGEDKELSDVAFNLYFDSKKLIKRIFFRFGIEEDEN